ncbi:MAG: cytochrome c maturation protein CcmE [Desulfovibrio sp.]|nr:cytochrome c maturation protein CcmE [Desulfovibrio sp.]
MRKKNNVAIYVAAFVLFAGAVGYLCYDGFAKDSVYFLTVAEAGEIGPDSLKQARLFGLVSGADVNRRDGTAVFDLADKDRKDRVIPVVYKGAIPDAFKEGAEIIVEGGMKEDGKFLAKILMTKCPSKYKKENRAI